jgi:SAM-dependent methyltransferase
MLRENSPVVVSRESYWDSYYQRQSIELNRAPSQFAAFAMAMCGTGNIVDLGCGSGRDSLLFSRYGRNVTSVDVSRRAVKTVELLIEQEQAKSWDAHRADISADVDLRGRLTSSIALADGDPVTYYCRFLIHALRDEEESHLWSLLAGLTGPRDVVAIECRVAEDRNLPKSTPEHFRRFPTSDALRASAERNGFSVTYEYSGFGVAVHGVDDAFVTRFLLRAETEPASDLSG